MPLVTIDAIDDPRIEAFRHLKATNATRWQSRFVAEGDKLVERLLESPIRVVSLLVGRRYVDRYRTVVADGTTVYVVDDDQIDALIGFNFHRGVLACAERPAGADIATLCQAHPGRLTLVVCPAVQDPENLGAILRMAAAFGVSGLLLGRDCCDPFSRRVLRVSMGSALQLPMAVVADLPQQLSQLRQECGLRLWATVADRSASPLAELQLPPRLALLLGNEGHGLDPSLVELCDARVTIPLASGVDSLNVAVAAGILLYEVTRPR